MAINFQNEIIFASDKPSEAKMIAYKESKGTLRKIAPRLYTTNMVDSPENIVKRNLISILGWRFPGCVISHRSASSLRPTPNGNLFLTHKFTRRITDFPGLTLNVLEGPEHLSSDIKLGSADVYASSEERWMLEVLEPARRGKDGESKGLSAAEVEKRLDAMISIGIFEDGVGKLGYIYDVMREDLFYAIEGEGAWYNEARLRKLEPLKLEEAVIGINANWVTPNRRINHEKIIELVRTVRGTRSYGSAAMEIAFVVSGKLDAYISMRLAPWDIGAGTIIAKEVGAIATNLHGQGFDFLSTDTFLIANPHIHQLLLDEYIEVIK